MKCGVTMMVTSKPCQSAPECQLSKMGNAESYETLLNKTRALSDRELRALEDDLSYYAETGLIGINMSRLLVVLQPDRPPAAA